MKKHLLSVAVIGAALLLLIQPIAAQPSVEERAQAPSLETKILSKMHHTNQIEIKAGKLAMDRASGEKVRSYGDRLMRDHQSADEKVKALAKEKGITLIKIEPQTKEEKQHAEKVKETMQKLQQLEGKEFDPVFLQFMINGHEHAINTLSQANEKLDEGEVRDLVGKLIPILRQHLELAKNLKDGSNK